jgi:hypothetical protein
MPVIPALGRQKDHEFKASLDYVMSSKSALANGENLSQTPLPLKIFRRHIKFFFK